MQSVHYDKRGAKITITYEGDDCATKKDEVEQAANKLCSENVAMASVSFFAFLCSGLQSSSRCFLSLFGQTCQCIENHPAPWPRFAVCVLTS
jgi:hypothetical protein